MAKKDVPIGIIKQLDPYKKYLGNLIRRIDRDKHLVCFEDLDLDSGFYFYIQQLKAEKGEIKVLVDFKPTSDHSNNNTRAFYPLSELNKLIDHWISILEKYNTEDTIFDDPILESYYNEFKNSFSLVDEDAETSPFDTNRILIIDNHLEKLSARLDEYKTENNKAEIVHIQEEISELRETLSSKVKNAVIRGMSKIYAGISKHSTPLLIEIKKALIKKGITEGIDFTIELLKSISP